MSDSRQDNGFAVDFQEHVRRYEPATDADGNVVETPARAEGLSALTWEEWANAGAAAEAKGFEVVGSSARILLFDLDDEAQLIAYTEMRSQLANKFGGRELRRWRSKSGEGWHVVYETEVPLDFPSRVALAAACGSDPVKELLSIARYVNGIAEPSRLFKPPLPPKKDDP